MAQDNIPKNQIKSRNTIEQREHEDQAAARRVTIVDQDGNFQDSTNPVPAVQFFIRDGAPQAVVEDTSNPSNNRPLPVKLTGFDGDVKIQAENLNLETQLDGLYSDPDNTVPDTVGMIAHERSTTTDKTKQTQRVTAKRGTVDTDTVSQDVSLHDASGNAFDPKNPLPTSTAYEKFFALINASKWMELAVYDQVIPDFVGDDLTLTYKEDGALLGQALVSNYVSQTGWSLQLNRFIDDDDGSILQDDDGLSLNLD